MSFTCISPPTFNEPDSEVEPDTSRLVVYNVAHLLLGEPRFVLLSTAGLGTA